jgi:hypothetical protein
MRNMLWLGLVLGTMAACGDPCEKAGDRVTAKYEDCGIDIPEGGDTSADAECTDEAEALATCYADCIDAQECDVLAGTATTTTGLTDYAACLGDCVATAPAS